MDENKISVRSTLGGPQWRGGRPTSRTRSASRMKSCILIQPELNNWPVQFHMTCSLCMPVVSHLEHRPDRLQIGWAFMEENSDICRPDAQVCHRLITVVEPTALKLFSAYPGSILEPHVVFCMCDERPEIEPGLSAVFGIRHLSIWVELLVSSRRTTGRSDSRRYTSTLHTIPERLISICT